MSSIQKIVIVGFGVAGRLHGRILGQMGSRCTVSAIVDSSPLQRQQAAGEFPSARVCERIPEALDGPDTPRIIDLCVPSCCYLSLAEAALRTAKNSALFVEKPLGWNREQAEAFCCLTHNASVSYLDTYSSSRGIVKLRKLIADQPERLMTIDILFSKDRREDSMRKRGYHGLQAPDAWLIEGPHMVSIALTLAGAVSRVRSAKHLDMPLPGMAPVRKHGGGSAELVHECGTVTRLETRLFSPINRRSVRITVTDGTIYTLELPASKASFQQTTLSTLLPNGEYSIETFEDRPMHQCLNEALDTIPNASSMRHGMQVSSVLQSIVDVSRCSNMNHHQCARNP